MELHIFYEEIVAIQEKLQILGSMNLLISL